MQQTISISKGRGSLRHNNRTFFADNIDKSRTHLNIYFKQEPLKDAYEKLFGEALKEYNAKQKRSDRKIDNYMDHIRKSKNGEKLFYETIVQVGNLYTCNSMSENGEIAKEILEEYMHWFQQRNPNLYVFNAVLHMDEETPHLHIDWIPVANDYKNGLSVRNSLDKALKQQGIEGLGSKFANSTQNWQEAEKNSLAYSMEHHPYAYQHGWKRAEDSGLHREKKSIDHYKATMQEIKNQVQTLPDQIKSTPLPMSKDKVVVSKKDLEDLELRAKLSIVSEEAAKKLTTELKSRVNDQVELLDNHQMMMDQTIDRLNREADLAEENRRKYEKLYNQQLNINIEAKILRDENLCYETEIKNLRIDKASLKADIKTLKSDIDTKVSEAVKEATKPLEALKTRVKNLAFTVKTLVETLEYVKDHFLNPNRLPFKILDAACKVANNWLIEDECHEYAHPEPILSKEVCKQLEMKLVYKIDKEKGKGLYTEDGTLIKNYNSIYEAKAEFPNTKIKNTFEQGKEH